MDIDRSFSSSTNKVPNPSVLSFKQHEKDEWEEKTNARLVIEELYPRVSLKELKVC